MSSAVHTVQMFRKLTFHEYSALFKVLCDLSRTKGSRFYKVKDGTYYCHLLKNKGLQLILRHSENEDGISYSALEIIMNPMRLLNENEYLQLTSLDQSKSIYSAFEGAFKPIKKKFESRKRNRNLIFRSHLLDSYSYKRIDFAYNFYSEQIDIYMDLIKRANIPEGFELFRVYNESGKRAEPTKHSFYLFKKSKSKSKPDHVKLNINCYHKGEQMKEKNLPCDDVRAMYTIRFEIQCHYNKVYRIIKSKNLSKQGFSQFLNEDISEDVLYYYFLKSIGKGNYYTLSKAIEVIQSKRMKLTTKKELIETLKLVNDKRGIWKAKEVVTDMKKFNKQIKKLNELGVNAVTIPIAWKIDFLPNLFDLERF
jgi:hypothetical protein